MREESKSDYTEDELENIKNGKCWCGKPRSEFDKGMRVYCTKKHRIEWYDRTITWSNFRSEYLEEHEKKCVVCGSTPESMKRDVKSDYKKWLKMMKGNPKVMRAIDEVRLEKLEEVEKQYERAMDDDYLIKWEFGMTHSTLPDGLPKAPEKDHWVNDRFDVDHIIAVALDGEMWDKKNLQILCSKHHKEKTKLDMKKIMAKRRGLERFVDSDGSK